MKNHKLIYCSCKITKQNKTQHYHHEAWGLGIWKILELFGLSGPAVHFDSAVQFLLGILELKISRSSLNCGIWGFAPTLYPPQSNILESDPLLEGKCSGRWWDVAQTSRDVSANQIRSKNIESDSRHLSNSLIFKLLLIYNTFCTSSYHILKKICKSESLNIIITIYVFTHIKLNGLLIYPSKSINLKGRFLN